jgi:hypothetical protein
MQDTMLAQQVTLSKHHRCKVEPESGKAAQTVATPAALW